MNPRHGLKPTAFYAILVMAALCVILDIANYMLPRLSVARDACFLGLSLLLAGIIWRFRFPQIRRLVACDSSVSTISEPKAYIRYGGLAMVVVFTIAVGKHVF